VLDSFARRLIEKPLAAAARPLAAAGIGANSITLVGFAFGIGAAAAIACQLYLFSLGLLLANRLADGLDGAVARVKGATDFGGFLDILLDFLVYNALAIGFALAAPVNVLPALFLLLSFVGTGTSFLAYATLAAKRRLTHERQGRKSFYYLGGLAEGSETLLFFALACLLPQHFPLLAWIFAGLCFITTLGRTAQAWRDFRAN
jgi:phosphatidylglycerophosphate synthase